MSVKSQSKITHQQADGQVYLPYMKTYSVTIANLVSGRRFLIPVEKGQTVLGVSHRVVSAFNGTAPTCMVGDAADVDGYLTTAMVSPGVANHFVYSQGGAGAYAQGKYYAATGSITVDYNDDATTGEAEVSVYFSGKE